MTDSNRRTFAFTDKGLKGLPTPPKPRQLDYFDTKIRGLGLRVSYGGRKSWFIMYSDPESGKRQRAKLREDGSNEYGRLSLAEARKLAKARLGQTVGDGPGPAARAREQRHAPTVAKLVDDYYEHQTRAGVKSADRQHRRLKQYLVAEYGDLKARDLKRDHVKKLVRRITDAGAPVMANRIAVDIRSMYNFLHEEELGELYGVEGNPATHLRNVLNKERKRSRWLQSEELGAYWRALDHTPEPARTILKLCLATAQRQGNVIAMERSEIDLADRLWIIPGHKTKNGQEYRVPLNDLAAELIEARFAETSGKWLFAREDGSGPRARDQMKDAHARACQRAGIEGYTIHDGRRTFGSHADRAGFPRLIWDALLGHVGSMMADTYSGFGFLDKKRECVQAWADRIKAAASENVITLEAAK